MRKTVSLEQGLRFTIREGGVTLGTGVISKVLPAMTPAEKEKFNKGRNKEEKAAWKAKLAELGLAEADVEAK